MKKGFTLAELLGVIAVLAILAVLVVPNIVKIFTNSKEDLIRIQANNVKDAAELYAEDYCKSKIGADYTCPPSYVTNHYICLSEIQNPTSGDNSSYLGIVKYNGNTCVGVSVFSEETVGSGIYSKVDVYLKCGDEYYPDAASAMESTYSGCF